MKKKFNAYLIFYMLFGTLVTGIFAARPALSEAAYQRIPAEEEKAVKVGSYYFWTLKGEVCFSATPGGSHGSLMNLSDANDSFTDGDNVYYMASLQDGQWLVHYSIKERSGSKIRKMPATDSEDDLDYFLRAMMGSYLVINYMDYEHFVSYTYTYNISTKKWKKQITGGHAIASSGVYLVIEHAVRTDVSPFRMSIYKGKAGKLRKVKALGNDCYGGQFIGKYVYFSVTSYEGDGSITFYRIQKTGKGLKKLGSLEGSTAIVYSFTSKYCNLNIDGTDYRYTFRTKQLTELPGNN